MAVDFRLLPLSSSTNCNPYITTLCWMDSPAAAKAPSSVPRPCQQRFLFPSLFSFATIRSARDSSIELTSSVTSDCSLTSVKEYFHSSIMLRDLSSSVITVSFSIVPHLDDAVLEVKVVDNLLKPLVHLSVLCAMRIVLA